MRKLSQTDKIVHLLKDHPNKPFTAREIAEAIVSIYKDDYQEKMDNPRFKDKKSFINQIVAEIGAQKDALIKRSKHIFWQDKPRPRVYWYNPDFSREEGDYAESSLIDSDTINEEDTIFEHELYSLLIDYLNSEQKLYAMRIDEKRSKNKRGKGGNSWLHPDIVAMQAVDKEWDPLVRDCVKSADGQRVRLWSFELKVQLNRSNVRKSFFQAVSNSSWANEGYLVASKIDSNIEQELRMLSSLHGIGVIWLNIENPSESEVVLPAKARNEIDWQSVNSIVEENSDFSYYIELVSNYLQTGRVRKREWKV